MFGRQSVISSIQFFGGQKDEMRVSPTKARLLSVGQDHVYRGLPTQNNGHLSAKVSGVGD
jgi:hypothetical protein